MRGKLTKRSVEAVKCATTDVFLWDAELKGFGLKVTPKNHRVFLAQYWAPNLHRVRRRVTLGALGTLTVNQARDAAQRVLGRVANGEDPQANASEGRRAAKEATVATISLEYLEDIAPRIKPRTAHEYARLFQVYVIPVLGKKPVASITLRDVAAIHSAKRKQPYQANRVLNLLAAFLHWSELHGHRPRHSNPCRDIPKFPEHQRERFLSVAEIGALGRALAVAATVGLPPAPNFRRKAKDAENAKHRPKSADKPIPANPFAVAAIRFLVFTGWREQEALTLRWADLDLTRGAVTLPDTKTGKSHRPIGASAVDLLLALPRLDGSAFVFPGARDGRPLREIKRLWTAVRHAANLDGVRLHDLRHTVASFAMGSGHSLFLTGKLLGHTRAETTHRYSHLADDARKVIADSVSASLAAALAGHVEAKVLSLSSKRR